MFLLHKKCKSVYWRYRERRRSHSYRSTAYCCCWCATYGTLTTQHSAYCFAQNTEPTNLRLIVHDLIQQVPYTIYNCCSCGSFTSYPLSGVWCMRKEKVKVSSQDAKMPRSCRTSLGKRDNQPTGRGQGDNVCILHNAFLSL